MRQKISISRSMPLAVAAVAAVYVGAYMLGGLIGEMKLGRPSSTAGVGYLFVPVYSVIAGTVGFAIGLVLRVVLRKLGERDVVAALPYFVILTAVVTGVAAIGARSGVSGVVAYEQANAPQILRNSDQVTRTGLAQDVTLAITERSQTAWSFQRPTQPAFVWNGKKTTVRVNDSTYMTLEVEGRNASISRDFRGRTYLTEIEVLPLPWMEEDTEYLAVLARLRATSFRSMLLIYEPAGSLLYAELLERCGHNDGHSMGLTEDPSGPALIVNVCTPLKFRLEKRLNKSADSWDSNRRSSAGRKADSEFW